MPPRELKLPITGLVFVTGEPDTGKTTFCLTVPGVLPQDMVFMDDDLKTQPLAEALEKEGKAFAHYYNLQRMTSEQKHNKPLDFYGMVDKLLGKVEQEVIKAKVKYPVLVWDNFSRFEEAIRAHSLTVMSQYSDKSEAQLTKISQMSWVYTYQVYAQFLDRLMNIADLVFITCHVREQYAGQVKTGKLEARGQRPLVEKPNLRLWTRHNPNSPAPIGLVLKRPIRMLYTEEGMKPVNILPRRIVPLTWSKLIEYMNTPIGDRKPTIDETPTPFELSILDGELTEDQKNAIRIGRVTAEALGEEEVIPTIADDAARAVSLKADGYAPAVIAETLSAEFGRGYSIPEVLKFIS